MSRIRKEKKGGHAVYSKEKERCSGSYRQAVESMPLQDYHFRFKDRGIRSIDNERT